MGYLDDLDLYDDPNKNKQNSPDDSLSIDPASMFRMYQRMSPQALPDVDVSNTEAYKRYKGLIDQPSPGYAAIKAAEAAKPDQADYAPNFGRKLLAAATGFTAGLHGGPAGGIEAATNIINKPYNDALEEYKQKLNQTAADARLEDQEYNRRLSSAQFDLGEERKRQGLNVKKAQDEAQDQIRRDAIARRANKDAADQAAKAAQLQRQGRLDEATIALRKAEAAKEAALTNKINNPQPKTSNVLPGTLAKSDQNVENVLHGEAIKDIYRSGHRDLFTSDPDDPSKIRVRPDLKPQDLEFIRGYADRYIRENKLRYQKANPVGNTSEEDPNQNVEDKLQDLF